MRLVAIVSLGLVAAFLVATQPGLQSELAGIASGVAALGASAMKLRETLADWLTSRKRK